MAFLTLNGIPVPVAADTAEGSIVRAGSTERAFSGRLRRTWSASKREWRFRTKPLVQLEADAFRGLIEGLGEHFSFDADLYSSAGLRRSSGSGAPTVAEGPKHGAKFLLCGNDTWPLGFGATWTVFGFRAYTDGTQPSGIRWDHHLRDSTLGTFYTNGAPGGTDVSNYLNITTAGVLNIGAGGGAYLDDVVAVPYRVPATWVPAIYAHHNARPWSPLPRLFAAGDFAPAEVTVEGAVDSADAVDFSSSGALVTGEVLTFTLREV